MRGRRRPGRSRPEKRRTIESRAAGSPPRRGLSTAAGQPSRRAPCHTRRWVWIHPRGRDTGASRIPGIRERRSPPLAGALHGRSPHARSEPVAAARLLRKRCMDSTATSDRGRLCTAAACPSLRSQTSAGAWRCGGRRDRDGETGALACQRPPAGTASLAAETVARADMDEFVHYQLCGAFDREDPRAGECLHCGGGEGAAWTSGHWISV
jgi:hypothetical protein